MRVRTAWMEGGIAALSQCWRRLQLRERVMLTTMVGALLAAALWAFWLEPLLKQRSYWQVELPRLQAQMRALAPLLDARERQRLAREQRPTLTSLRSRIAAAGLADAVRVDAREGRWHVQVQSVPADVLWNWLLPLLADPTIELQRLQLQRTGDADMPAARISGSIVMKAVAGELR